MPTFRKIIIDEKEYLWKYNFDDYDYQNASLLVIKTVDKKGKLLIFFRSDTNSYGYCPFNKGVSAIYKNNVVTINLNQPKFVCEIVRYIMQTHQPPKFP